MSRAPGFLAIAFALLCGALPARAAQDAALERGTAITDPATLRELDGGRFRLDRMLLPERSADAPLSNSELFALPSMAPVRQAIDGEFERYIITAQSEPAEGDRSASAKALISSCSTGRSFIQQQTRFVLAGIVNRMDRAYVSAARLRRDPPDLPPDADQHGDRRQCVRRSGCR